jgi:hypothetical protein
MPPDRELVLRFEDLRHKYSLTVPRVKQAKSVGDLVDHLVRDRLYRQPERIYRECLIEVLAEDAELSSVYLA